VLAERILLLVPHPDDEIVGCCAAIGRARAAGSGVYAVYLTNGVPAREVLWPWDRASHDERVARRWREAEQAASHLGIVEAARQDIPTRMLKSHLRQAAALVGRLLDRLRPHVLWAPAYEGGHQDHDVASFLASLMGERTPVWEFSEYNYAGGTVQANEFIATAGTEQILTLTPQEAAYKHQALSIYASEHGNLRHIATHQEAFRPLTHYDYARPPHEGRLFYQRFQWVPWHPRVDHCRPAEVCRALTGFAGVPAAA
jgi:LmbE family N-acetylglucosaminyl deacetylase